MKYYPQIIWQSFLRNNNELRKWNMQHWISFLSHTQVSSSCTSDNVGAGLCKVGPKVEHVGHAGDAAVLVAAVAVGAEAEEPVLEGEGRECQRCFAQI